MAMGNMLYFSGAEPLINGVPRRRWLGFQVGPEPGGASEGGSVFRWTLSDLDLLDPHNGTARTSSGV
jgi:hypothetical protein